MENYTYNLHNLYNNNDVVQQENLQAFVNKTEINFTKQQLLLLNEGPKGTYDSPENNKHGDLLYNVEIEYILRNLVLQDKKHLNTEISNIENKEILSKFKNDLVKAHKNQPTHTHSIYPNHSFSNLDPINTPSPNLPPPFPVLNALPSNLPSSANNQHSQSDNLINIPNGLLDTKKQRFKILKTISHQLENNNAQIVLADKTNALVAVYQDKYVSEMEIALTKNNFIEIKNDKGLTNQTKLKNLLYQLYTDKIITHNTYKDLYPKTFTPCLIHGKYKSHKPMGGYRPLVDTHTSYISKTSKWLNGFLKKYNYSKFNVKNTPDFIQKLNKLKINSNVRLVSLDVESMYGSINLDLAIDTIIARYRVDKNKLIKIKLKDLHDLLTLCTKEITRQFNNKRYMQVGGILMGQHLGGLMSDIHVSIVEQKVMQTKGIGYGTDKAILSIHRYVDDFLLSISHEDHAQKILDTFNSIDKQIRFTMELEADRQINFLDLTIIRNDTDLQYKLYRKLSQNNVKISYQSLFPKQILNNNVKQEIIRAHRLSSNEKFLSIELNNIRNIYMNNHYPLSVINKYIREVGADQTKRYYKPQKQSTPLLQPSPHPPLQISTQSLPISNKIFKYPNNNKSILNYQYNINHFNLQFNLPFSQLMIRPPMKALNKRYIKVDNISNFNKISPIFRHFKNNYTIEFGQSLSELQLVSGSPPTFLQYFKNIAKHNNVNTDPSSVVYFFGCACAETYIGSTGRQMSLRMREHIKFDHKSKIYMHVQDTMHIINYDNFKVLLKCNNNIKRNVAETLMIATKNPSLNDSRGWHLIMDVL